MGNTVKERTAPGTEEMSAVLDVVDRFRKRELDPRVERPERVLTGEEMVQLCNRAIEVGLVPSGEEAGLGLWEDVDEQGRVALGVLVLEALAGSNAGAAYQLHLLALGRHLATRLSMDADRTLLPCLQGVRGLARDALARFLDGKTPDENARKLLKEHFPGPADRSLPFLLQAGESWEVLLAPTWQDDPPALKWMLLPREDLVIRSMGPAHGFDETPVSEIVFPSGPGPIRTADADQALAREVLVEGLGLHALALMAIGLGSVRRAYATAKEYASDRTQGGRPIFQHAAVRLMLGNISAVIGSVAGMLQRFDAPPRSLPELIPVFQARVVAHPLLCAAANQALQVLGGTGYMQDAGIEKIVRDTNHLKVSFGAPDDLRLFLAAVEAP